MYHTRRVIGWDGGQQTNQGRERKSFRLVFLVKRVYKVLSRVNVMVVLLPVVAEWFLLGVVVVVAVVSCDLSAVFIVCHQ